MAPAPAPTTTTTTNSTSDTSTHLHPEKPTPYTLDAGHLLILDANPLTTPTPSIPLSEPTLASTARDAAQTLLNHLLTSLPITSLPSNRASGSGVVITLPQPSTLLPREKAAPKPAAPTKWEAFARKKGVGKFNPLRRKGQEGEGRAGRLIWDEGGKEWRPRYGFGDAKAGKEWVEEVDVGREEREGRGGKGREGRVQRVERVKRERRSVRRTERRGKSGSGSGAV